MQEIINMNALKIRIIANCIIQSLYIQITSVDKENLFFQINSPNNAKHTITLYPIIA